MGSAELYQELDMFVENFLTTDIMLPISMTDKQKVLAHGFDVKTSFRKVAKKGENSSQK